jgi:microcystin degradation protein MlrC
MGRFSMAVAIASMMQESNTFSPVNTRYEDFAPVFGAELLARHEGKMTELGGFIDVLKEAKQTIAPIAAAWAITANRSRRADFSRLVSQIVDGITSVSRLEAVLLAMHGAQCAQEIDDAEGYLLHELRKVVGPSIPIVTTLDLHANVTRAMVEHATAIVGYHTYPHVDMYETGVKAARLLLATLAGGVTPAMAFRKLPMIINAENMQTTRGPMHELIETAETLERNGSAEAVSIFGVQAWMDIEEMGNTVVVVTNGDRDGAEMHASTLANKYWSIRRQFEVKLTPVKEAIRKAQRIKGGPIILAESSDSTGSGSPGDSTGVLRELLAARLAEPSAIFLVDPDAVAQAHRAGVGATPSMKIGGKFDRQNSRPVKVVGYVRMLSDGRWVPRARSYNPGIESSMGRAALLEVGSVKILMAERSAMTVDPELFRSHGIDPVHMKIVVVKSPNGFRAAYEPIAKGIFVVDTPGISTANLKKLPWKRLPRPIYPLDSGVRYRA